MMTQKLRRLAVGAGAIAVGLLGWQFSVAEAELGIPNPGALSYQGTLNQDGVPVDGEVTIGVTIFDSATQTNMLCQTSQLVTVSDGRFTIELPDACTEAVEANDEAWLAITADFGDGPQAFPIERVHAAPYAVRARNAHNGIPVGGVLAWWRADDGTPIPDGFEICDGSEVADPHSPIAGRVKPDLRDRFVRGASADFTAAGTAGWQSGGADSATTTGGDHAHVTFRKFRIGSEGAQRVITWDDAGASITLFDWDDGGGGAPSGDRIYYFGDRSSSAPRSYYTEPGTGVHSHDVDTVPAYVGLIYLVRVR